MGNTSVLVCQVSPAIHHGTWFIWIINIGIFYDGLLHICSPRGTLQYGLIDVPAILARANHHVFGIRLTQIPDSTPKPIGNRLNTVCSLNIFIIENVIKNHAMEVTSSDTAKYASLFISMIFFF